MADEVGREPARDPQDLERLLASQQWAGDVDGMAALYKPDAVVCSDGAEADRLDLGLNANVGCHADSPFR